MKNNNFTKRLNAAVEKSPKSVKQIIEETGLSRAGMFYLMKGQRLNPGFETINKLERSLGVKLTDKQELFAYKPLKWSGEPNIELTSINVLGWYKIIPKKIEDQTSKEDRFELSFYFNEQFNGSVDSESIYKAIQKADQHFKRVLTSFFAEV